MEEVLIVCVERSEAKKLRKNKQKRIKMTVDESAEKCNMGVEKQNKKMDRSQCINCENCFRREKRRALFRLVIEITNQWEKLWWYETIMEKRAQKNYFEELHKNMKMNSGFRIFHTCRITNE